MPAADRHRRSAWPRSPSPSPRPPCCSSSSSGKLDLDAPIQRYVPAFPEKPWPVTAAPAARATWPAIRHYARGEFASTRRYATSTEALAIFKDDPLVHRAGHAVPVHQLRLQPAGRAVEGASGQPFLDYVRANVFEPAGMVGARDDDVLAIIPHRAQGYLKSAGGRAAQLGARRHQQQDPGRRPVRHAPRTWPASPWRCRAACCSSRTSVARMLTRQTDAGRQADRLRPGLLPDRARRRARGLAHGRPAAGEHRALHAARPPRRGGPAHQPRGHRARSSPTSPARSPPWSPWPAPPRA